ncbi:MAG: fimbrillin family protein [Paramuribaculum sp.]|nr:fimbrillin family protein [Paramuribaculum sp.]
MKKNLKWIVWALFLLLLPLTVACGSDDPVLPEPEVPVEPANPDDGDEDDGDDDPENPDDKEDPDDSDDNGDDTEDPDDSDDNGEEEEDPNLLPENTYPVEFSSLINQFSTDETSRFELSFSDYLTVQSAKIDENGTTNWADAHTDTYQVSAGGTLTATNTPAYWSRKDEERNVRGWYAAGSTSSNLPTEWSVPVDQTGGFRDGVMLYGYGKANYGTTHTLQLYHQMAMVKVNVKFEGTATMYYNVTAVTLGSNDIATTGSFVAPAAGDDYGRWTAKGTGATIRPQEVIKVDANAATVQAIMVPQAVGGKKLVNIEISNGKTLSWTPKSGETLKPGTVTRYDVTVSSDLNTLKVTKTVGNSWGFGSTEDTSSWLDLPDYGKVKIGDYYYSDGSWSDGGFLGFDKSGHGSVKWASPKPAPVNTNPVTGKSRKVIGIVFSVDNERIGEAEKQALNEKRIKPHGLVICAQDIPSTQWDAFSNDESSIGIPGIIGDRLSSLYSKANADISGYKVCKTILERRTDDIFNRGNYKAITDARALAAPSTSTGWFIPSGGQWFDMLRNFIGMDFSDKSPFYFESNEMEDKDYSHFDWQIDYNLDFIAEYNEDFVERINVVFSRVPSSDCTLFSQNDNFITSTLADAGNMYYTVLYPKYVTYRRVSKAYWIKARPVLAF